MPSIFTRSRTASTPNNSLLPPLPPKDNADEFGRVSSRGSNLGATTPTGKREKKREKDKRNRTYSSPAARDDDDGLASVPDGSFLPLCLSPPVYDNAQAPLPKEHDYGYLCHERHVVLGLEQVARLVETIGQELCARGLTTPFLFSTLALDITPSKIKRLVHSFMHTCTNPGEESEKLWREEAQFAEPPDLAMCLRWGLARIVRIIGGQEVRGFLSWTDYATWREAETAAGYPAGHFQAFLPHLLSPVRSLLISILTLMTRLTAHSNSSGLTPPTLSPLFGPLLFGLGAPTLAFHHTYANYLRAAHATEHLLLSFIRLQDTQSVNTLGLPSRLKDWIRGYPNSIPPLDKFDKARRGARTTRVLSVRRNVRMYTPDLVRTAASWASRNSPISQSKEWGRIAPKTLNLPPRFAESYRKRFDLPSTFQPELVPGALAHSASATPSTSSTTSTLTDESSTSKDFLGGRDGEDRFRSLTDLKWGEFEAGGFGGADEKKLQFDLTESARKGHTDKRQTLTWSDFSTSGFTRTDAPLSATLQFSAPLTHTISAWPTQSAELQRKLKKAQKGLPPFGWDTEPVLGGEEIIEEAFLDVFCDLVYSSGWMDRTESTFRDCNWALVEYKSLPSSKPVEGATGDPRTSSTILLYEEFVPFEYRTQLSVQGSTKRRLPAIFSPGKSKAWKAATTLNGRPYVVGTVPKSPTAREIEFEGLLNSGAQSTKIISLNPTTLETTTRHHPPLADRSHTAPAATVKFATSARSDTPTPSTPTPTPPPKKPFGDILRGDGAESPMSPTKKSRFRMPNVGSSSGRKATPAEYDVVDFETRTAVNSDDSLDNDVVDGVPHQRKRDSLEDAWVDILVGSQRRLEGQQAEMRKPAGPRERGDRGLRGGRSDPELASKKVAQALAEVKGHPPTDDEADAEMEPIIEPSTPPRKRMGTYFDYHPDRRPVLPETRVSEIVEMSRERVSSQLEREDEDDEEDQDHDQNVTGISNHPVHESTYSDGEFEPMAASVVEDEVEIEVEGDSPDIEVPAFVSEETERFQKEQTHSKTESGTLPGLPLGAAAPKAVGKTAALIEMYRERERIATSIPPKVIAPARISSLPVTPVEVGLPPGASPPRVPAALNATDLELVPPPIALATPDRGTPSPTHRYVHGAPLHNVLEEEDEED